MLAKIIYLSAIIVLSLSCGTQSSKYPAKEKKAKAGQPVETQKPNADYKPAFTGQTRIGSVKTTTPIAIDLLAKDLGRPWAAVTLPDGRLLITEKSGYMVIRDNNGNLIKKITGFPDVDDDGQGGLLDVAADPSYNVNKIIYWSFSEPHEDGNLTAVAKGLLNEVAGVIENPRVIFRATPVFNSSLHFGSRLVFDKDGNLFVSSGERSDPDGRKQAQWLHSGLGKIFKITPDGNPAPDNPFIYQQGTMPEIFAFGFRNVQSLDIHPVTGELWEAEFGPRGGDELNLIKPGKNYGWPVITYGIEYSGDEIGEAIQQKEGMAQPVYYWDPVLSPSGMTFYKGNTIPEWENNLFIGGLSSTHICRLVLDNNKVTGEERLLAEKGERFRDIAYAEGMLYAVTDAGNLYRISKK
ncbi:MAG: PQQ-dependent sugar dehydrogenase [Chitinophagaceae bacterium]|nr:PQQ-dependent sugar dehydrogenase [Chitinophagaceae bacterium]